MIRATGQNIRDASAAHTLFAGGGHINACPAQYMHHGLIGRNLQRQAAARQNQAEGAGPDLRSLLQTEALAVQVG